MLTLDTDMPIILGAADATGTSFVVTFMTNVVLDAPVTVDQIELYVSALSDDTVVNITAPAYNGSNGPQVSHLHYTYPVLTLHLPGTYTVLTLHLPGTGCVKYKLL